MRKLKIIETDNTVKRHLRECFPHKPSQGEEKFFWKTIKTEVCLVLFMCSMDVPDELPDKFTNFPPSFKNFTDGREDIEKFKRNNAEKQYLLTQPVKKLTASYILANDISYSFVWTWVLHASNIVRSYTTLYLYALTFMFSLLPELEEKRRKSAL